MLYEDRKKIIDWLATTEHKYTVSEWEHNGVHFWPVLKILVFFTCLKVKKKVEKKPLIQRIHRTILRRMHINIITGYIYFKLTMIKKSTVVFSGANSHRITYQSKFFNRYFDPIMDYLESEHEKNNLLVEYSPINLSKTYKPYRVIDATKILPYFQWKYGNSFNKSLAQGSEFSRFLEDVETHWGICSKEIICRLLNSLQLVYVWKALWLHILKKARPRLVFVLCYYDTSMYGLNLACHELDIPSVDMQHGGQGSLHPAYNYNQVPEAGYALLPNIFWCWDKASSCMVQRFTRHHPVHRVVVGGNPWITEIGTTAPEGISFTEYTNHKKVILFTLQTTLTPILDNYIIDAIKSTPDDYVWWLRLHPRMTVAEIAEIRDNISQNHLSGKVDIEIASKLPLPFILNHCFAHISKSSGSIGEAALLCVKINIILDPIGYTTYNDLVIEGYADYYCSEEDGDLWPYILLRTNSTKNHNGVNNATFNNFKIKIHDLLKR